jgi:polar amino acid transport system permease protein
MNAIWDWSAAIQALPLILQGLVTTVAATVLASVVAVVLGLVLALLMRVRIIRYPVAAFVEFIRNTPLLIQLYFLFFVLPLAGLRLSGLVAGVIGLGLHFATYMAVVYRAGIDGVPTGQWEASSALNLPRRFTWFGVILPQAIRRVLPALGNYVILMFKETPLLSTITVGEMLLQAQNFGSATFHYLEPLSIVGLLFLAVSLLASIPIRSLEKKLEHQ